MKRLILITLLLSTACGSNDKPVFETKEDMLYEVFDAWCDYIQRCEPRIPVHEGGGSAEYCNGEFVADYCTTYDCTQSPDETDKEIIACIDLYDDAVCTDNPDEKPVCGVWQFKRLPR